MHTYAHWENLTTSKKLLIFNSAACLALSFLLIRIYSINSLQALEDSITSAPPTAFVENIGLPKEVRIPSIGVDASIQSVGTEPNGDMSVPADAKSVGWFKGGPRPGEDGNSVIAGHLDTIESTAVFWNLRKLKAGDYIYVTDENAKELEFKINRIESYPVDSAPLDRIFGASDGSHLNLITCDGTWNPQKHAYNKRLVVYSDRIE